MYELIKKLCATKGISPTKLCTEITGSRGNLPTWKKGNINPVSLTKIADYFDVSVDYLLGRTSIPNLKLNKIVLSSDQQRLLQMYNLLSDIEKGEILGELKAMTTSKRPVQTVLAVARSDDNRPPRTITSNFDDVLNAPDITDKY